MKFIPFKRFVQSRKGGAWGRDAGKDEVDVSCVRVADFEYDKLTSKKILSTIRSIPARQYKNIKLNKGDILIEKSGGGETTLVGRAISFDQEIDAICSNFIERIEIKTNKLEPKFACYVLASAYSNKINASCIKQTTGIQNLDVDAYLSSVLVPDIPKEKQRRIFDFLESKIKDISDSIFKKRVCLQKLSEYRQSLITQAVTKGLDPNVEMTHSDKPMLKSYPKHWQISKISRVCTVQTGKTPSGLSEKSFTEDKNSVHWVTPGDFSDDGIYRGCARRLSEEAEKEVPVYSAHSVLFVGIGASIGKVMYSAFPVSSNQQINGISCGSKLLPQFLMYFLSARCEITRETAPQSTLPILNQTKTGEIYIPIPPMSEQKAIVGYVDSILNKLYNTDKRIAETLVKLYEYRSSLIIAAVTGKIDIDEVK